LESQVETNLYSAYHLTRTLLPAMMKPQSRTYFQHLFHSLFSGVIKMAAAYSISKFAMDGFNKKFKGRNEIGVWYKSYWLFNPGRLFLNLDSWGQL